MAMKGRPLAKLGYEQELKSIKGFVAMQNKADPHPAASDHVSVMGCLAVNTVTLLPIFTG